MMKAHTAFQTELESKLLELELVTAHLRRSDPGDLGGLHALIGQRGTALTATLALLESPEYSTSKQAIAARERLHAVHAAGADLSERVKIVQAATRDSLREMHRVQFALRAVGAEAPGCAPSMVEILA